MRDFVRALNLIDLIWPETFLDHTKPPVRRRGHESPLAHSPGRSCLHRQHYRNSIHIRITTQVAPRRGGNSPNYVFTILSVNGGDVRDLGESRYEQPPSDCG
jgi:hypothetical protein